MQGPYSARWQVEGGSNVWYTVEINGKQAHDRRGGVGGMGHGKRLCSIADGLGRFLSQCSGDPSRLLHCSGWEKKGEEAVRAS